MYLSREIYKYFFKHDLIKKVYRILIIFDKSRFDDIRYLGAIILIKFFSYLYGAVEETIILPGPIEEAFRAGEAAVVLSVR